jgi:hypothetical protein
MIVVRDEIENIIKSIQSTGSIDVWVDNTGSYTVTTSSTGNLEIGFKVVLKYADSSLDRDVILTDVTDTTFTFDGSGISQPTTWEMALYFEIGHQRELHKKYTNKAKAINKRVQEYPLFWLFTNFTKEPGDEEFTEFSTELSGAIVDFTKLEYYEEQRIENKYKPVLYPYYELMVNAFNSNRKKFVLPYGNKRVEFGQTDRPFFGSENPEANILPQFTDAIEWSVSLDWFKEKNNCQQV